MDKTLTLQETGLVLVGVLVHLAHAWGLALRLGVLVVLIALTFAAAHGAVAK